MPMRRAAARICSVQARERSWTGILLPCQSRPDFRTGWTATDLPLAGKSNPNRQLEEADKPPDKAAANPFENNTAVLATRLPFPECIINRASQLGFLERWSESPECTLGIGGCT